MLRLPYLLFCSFLLCSNVLHAQFSELDNASYSSPKRYKIEDITFVGMQNTDQRGLLLLTHLAIGDTISYPSDDLSGAIESLWQSGKFGNIKLNVVGLVENKMQLEFELTENFPLSRYNFVGVKRGDWEDLKKKLSLRSGVPVNQELMNTVDRKIKEYYTDKGFLNTEVTIRTRPDEKQPTSQLWNIVIDKKQKVKINEISFEGNTAFTAKKLKKRLKETKEKRWWSILKASKYVETDYYKDKENIIALYREKGYRDAAITFDTVQRHDDRTVDIKIRIKEEKPYYFRNITWLGNSKYPASKLSSMLGIKKGDIYNQKNLEQNLYMNPNGQDVTSLYMDDGHLFFNVMPAEINIEKDSIDIEMRMFEGKQATIDEVTVSGNTKTYDHVILRELTTRPGQLFRRTDLMRSQTGLQQLGYFNPEKLNVIPKPNPKDGTVDIEYIVEEKPSDQFEASVSYGGQRVFGSLGVSFNNFSLRNIANRKTWKPLPTGDGQKLSTRAQFGQYFQSYNFSFTEPWIGGKKPNSLSVTLAHSIWKISSTSVDNVSTVTNLSRNSIISVGYGKRLQAPDDFFTLYSELSYQYFHMFNSTFVDPQYKTGFYNNMYGRIVLSRSSVNHNIYPTAGSTFRFTLQGTLPYSKIKVLARKEGYDNIPPAQRLKWVEFYKFKFDAEWFSTLKGKLVLFTRANIGYMNYYNQKLGLAPFDRFYMGGTGLNSNNAQGGMFGQDIVGLRGYDDLSISGASGAGIYNRFTIELRHKIIENQMITAYGLAFAEGGSAWTQNRQFNPFELRRSAGVGLRLFMPMIGLIGMDYGWRLDNIPSAPGMAKSQFHFIIGQNFN